MIAEIIDEMNAVLDAAVNPTNTFPVQVVSGRMFAPTPPTIDIYPADPFRTTDAAGFGDVSGAMVFIVRARVNAIDNDAEQALLLLLMDDDEQTSVPAALLEDQTLNGRAHSIEVDGPSGFRLYEDVPGQKILLGCEWIVTVLGAQS